MARRNFGTVRRLPSGRWQARYSTDDGERIKAPTTFPTKADAHHWLASVETDIIRGTWQDPTLGRITIADWSERWMATKLPTVRRATADQYEYILRLHIVPHLGDREIGSHHAVRGPGVAGDAAPRLRPRRQHRGQGVPAPEEPTRRRSRSRR